MHSAHEPSPSMYRLCCDPWNRRRTRYVNSLLTWMPVLVIELRKWASFASELSRISFVLRNDIVSILSFRPDQSSLDTETTTISEIIPQRETHPLVSCWNLQLFLDPLAVPFTTHLLFTVSKKISDKIRQFLSTKPLFYTSWGTIICFPPYLWKLLSYFFFSYSIPHIDVQPQRILIVLIFSQLEHPLPLSHTFIPSYHLTHNSTHLH